jgi:hypothetical protein
MKNEDVQRLIQLREFVAGYYNELEGKNEPASITQTRDVARFCESVGASIDDLIKDDVTFQ